VTIAGVVEKRGLVYLEWTRPFEPLPRPPLIRIRPTLLCWTLAALLGSATSAQAASPLLVGAAEDAAKQPDLVTAKAKMDLAQLAGLGAIRLTAQWAPGIQRLDGGELVGLENAVGAAALDGIQVFVSIYPTGSSVTPLTQAARDDFSAYAASIAAQLPTVKDFIIGNEPNLNRFWMPQFDRHGRDVAAPAYEALLAETYDALKAVDPAIDVIGGAVSPRGGDRPGTGRDTHSPTTFIPDLGAAYRKSGRTLPIMDAFAFHPYMESSHVAPTLRHPHSTSVSIDDYGKLVALLGKAFRGTAQKGASLPIVYDEFGVQSRVAPPKLDAYSNTFAPAASDAVSESTQAQYYKEAMELASCQPTVKALFLFHVSDELNMAGWQSGLYYADDTPKSSLAPVKAAAEAAAAGTLVSCG
jgi:hypothetical protein